MLCSFIFLLVQCDPCRLTTKLLSCQAKIGSNLILVDRHASYAALDHPVVAV